MKWSTEDERFEVTPKPSVPQMGAAFSTEKFLTERCKGAEGYFWKHVFCATVDLLNDFVQARAKASLSPLPLRAQRRKSK